jgi:hypothetical protein
MIVRVTFLGVVKGHDGKKIGRRDYVDIHAASIGDAKELWNAWNEGFLKINSGLRGASDMYHPGGKFGEIRAESFKEHKEEDEES